MYMYIHIHNVYNFQNFQIYLFFPCAFFQREVDQVLKTWAQRFALVLASLRPNVLHEHWMLVYNMPWVTEGMCFYNELHRQPTWAPNSFWAPNYQEISMLFKGTPMSAPPLPGTTRSYSALLGTTSRPRLLHAFYFSGISMVVESFRHPNVCPTPSRHYSVLLGTPRHHKPSSVAPRFLF